MSQLQNDPIRVVPKRVLLLGLSISVIIIVISFLFQWSVLQMLGGFWIGLVVNLITFRLIVIGSKNFLDRRAKGINSSMIPNLMIRMMLLASALLGAYHLGILAFYTALMGISMVRTAIQLDGFFSFGYKKND